MQGFDNVLTGSFDTAGQLFEWLLQQPAHLESIPRGKKGVRKTYLLILKLLTTRQRAYTGKKNTPV